MTIDRIFIAFMVLCGLAIAAILVLVPESRAARIPPYFWVLIAMALFEGLAFARNQGAPGTMIAMPTRLIGFAVAIALMLAIPYFLGQAPVRLF